MANVKLGEQIFNNITVVKLNTIDGDTVEFYEESAPIENVYVIGAPVDFTLSLDSWNGTTYALKAENYKVGVNDVQIGLPSATSTTNANAVVKAALTIVTTSYTSANSSNGTPAYTTLNISAVNAPTRDITVAIFGLEAILT